MVASPEQLMLSNWITLAALASPHILYAYIWFFSAQFHAVFKKRSVEVFETMAWVLKGLQFSAVTYWYIARSPGIEITAIPPLAAFLGLALVAAGQVLNVGIFRAIGHAGVYYGFKLGHTVPWVDGFPFNVVSHPQYVGSVLTVWGMAVLVWTQAPVGLGWLAVYWTALYVLTGWQESCL